MSDEFYLAHIGAYVIILIFMFLLGIITRGLREVINDSRVEQKKLSEAINILSVMISKEYVTRAEASKSADDIWSRLDSQSIDIVHVSERVTRLER